jgi:hypothetical protein
MRDEVVISAVVAAFATLVTAHVAIVLGLAFRVPRWRAPAALFVPPLAPYWAWRQRMSVRAGVWIVSLLGYVVARIVALR